MGDGVLDLPPDKFTGMYTFLFAQGCVLVEVVLQDCGGCHLCG
jgi:hypothetical protein